MKKLYLISGTSYTFNLFNDVFSDQTIIITDSDGDQITSGVTETWINKFGTEYTGDREKKNDIWYKKGTDEVIKKSKLVFTPTLGGNVTTSPVYISDEYTKIQRVRLVVENSYSQDENPGLRDFTYLFARDTNYPRNEKIINYFLKNTIPAGLTTESIYYPDLSDVVFENGTFSVIE